MATQVCKAKQSDVVENTGMTLCDHPNTALQYHDEDLLRSTADPLLCLLRLVWVRHTKPDSMALPILGSARVTAAATAALVDGIQRLLLTAPQLDAAELSAASYTHEQVAQASRARSGTYGHHGLEANVVLGHELARHQWVQGKAILISLNLLRKVLTCCFVCTLCRAL